ncbi:hypothetical protein SLS64_006386 [Diaporthe eres]|uniref:GED domain-containing protein n=1 Tax=Diaporthe eres TaxID=83184 RepID=A0ABR1P9J3_DIAER
MGSTTKTDNAIESLGNQALLDKIDRLRELNVGSIVSLPQLIVVGDQSSGKSSVLESLTGFPFPRATGLCTRYATQITCRREPKRSVSITIIPRPNANDIVRQRLRQFHRCLDELDAQDLADIFEDANRAMGIRSSAEPVDNSDDGSITFSEDILKIEINGPDQPGLTVIDVPGILRLAKDADPNGSRTVGVLTKPDLAPERAMQQNILDLIQGRRQELTLGYCVVKNRGADDKISSLQKRDEEERAFFLQEPWTSVASTGRLGSGALKTYIRDLLMDISKKEFPIVKKEIAKKLSECVKRTEAIGPSRGDEKSQRAYLGKLAASFERIVGYSLNAYYTEDQIFDDKLEMRLITRIINLNEVFSEIFSQRGHTRHFDQSHEKDDHGEHSQIQPPEIDFDIPNNAVLDLEGIIRPERFQCPEPSDDSLVEHIEDIFRKSRGPELGTFGGALLATTFKEQSRRWEDLVTSHVSDAIALVHHFIVELLNHICADNKQVMAQLWDNILLEKLQESYKHSMRHANFLLEVEREGKPVTYNHYFNAELQKGQGKRLRKSLGSLAIRSGDLQGPVIRLASLSSINITRSNPEQVREHLHDILESYYKVSVKRFVDVICQQVIDHFLLNGKDSPLHVFSTDLVFDLSADALEMIAGEDQATKQKRERLRREMESLEAAMKVLRG